MARTFRILNAMSLDPQTRLPGNQTSPVQLALQSPAQESMTDLMVVPAATISPKQTIDEANRRMLVRGVRMLFVVAESGELEGIITASDVLGEKPLRAVEIKRIPHGDILVEHIMTPAKDIDVLEYNDVRSAWIGDIVETLRNAGRRYALVVARGSNGPYVRGLFSAAQIARDLGIAIQTPAIFKTFAEIETVVQGRLHA